jgi:hypothetical protein
MQPDMRRYRGHYLQADRHLYRQYYGKLIHIYISSNMGREIGFYIHSITRKLIMLYTQLHGRAYKCLRQYYG